MARQRRSKGSLPESPTCNCVLLCDDVIISQGKGKHTLVGVIGTIGVAGLPAVLAGSVAYIRIQNVYGSQRLVARFEFAKDNRTLFEFEVELTGDPDPLNVFNIIVPIRPFKVLEPGMYWFSILSGGAVLAQTPILIQTARKVRQ